MAIVYFPTIYEDELMYSVCARFYWHSGFLTYRDVAGMLYQVRNARPSIEFINNMAPEVRELLLKQCSMETIIHKHTMFPMYMRFYGMDRRKETFQALLKMDSNKNIFPRISYKENTRYLRYCPVCAKEDRERYGETYWHRSHQLYGNDICYRHECYLINSSVMIGGNVSPNLTPAEMEVSKEANIIKCDNTKLMSLARYMTAVFQAPMDFERDYLYGEYLGARLNREKYISKTGVQRKLDTLYQDYREYYKGLSQEYILSMEQVQKIFNGKRVLMHEICQMALWEGISVEELLNPDENIIQAGTNALYQRVALNLEIDYDTVKLIGDAISSEQNRMKQNSMRKSRKQDKWNKLDMEMLPQVQKIIEEMKEQDGERPVKISITGVCKAMKLPDKRFEYLPMCKKVIRSHMETQEHYWARELVWAVKQMEDLGEPMNWKHIRNYTNLRKVNVKAALLELKAMDMQVYELVKNLL